MLPSVFDHLLQLQLLTTCFRVAPFIVLALLLEELIPVLALYAPFMLPSTCLLPAQYRRIEGKKTEKAAAAASAHRALFSHLKSKETPAGYLPLQFLRSETGAAAAVCRQVN